MILQLWEQTVSELFAGFVDFAVDHKLLFFFLPLMIS